MRRILLIVASGCLLSLVALLARQRAAEPPSPRTSQTFDILIRHGRVMDGSGNPWRRADIGVRSGRIAAVGRLADARAGREIDAGDHLVTPGFIDVHSHAADGLTRAGLQQGQPMLAQGVTTVIVNPDGGGPTDLAAQRASLQKLGVGINVALLIGHGGIREAVIGEADRAPSDPELQRMRELVQRAMAEGAFGLSSGPFYAPGSFASTEELIALAEVAAGFGGVYTSHIRDEGNYTIGLVAAVEEVIRIADEAKLRGIVSHMKALGPDSWGLSFTATERMDAARARGVEVLADQYPYEASSTSLTGALIPRWAQAGGETPMRSRIAEADSRARLLVEIRENIRRRGGPEALVVAHYTPERALEGRNLKQIAQARGRTPEDTVLDLVSKGDVSIVSFNMSEKDIEHIMRQPYTMTCSDGGLVFPTEGKPHPRNYGAFARKLSRYVRERHTIGLEHAIRSMTSLPAQVFGLVDRGVIREGAWADIAIFDPAAVRDTATYQAPHQLAAGMDYVLVNGTVVVENGRFTAALPGQVLKK